MRSHNKKPNRLLIKNFGPIEKADLVFGDFTVIIGPNASGKTFIMNLVDRLMTFVSHSLTIPIMNNMFKAINEILLKDNDKYPIIIDMKEYPDDTIDKIVNFVLENIMKMDSPAMTMFQNVYDQIFRYFPSLPKDLVRFGKDQATITASFEQANISIVIPLDGKPKVKLIPNREFLRDYVKGSTANLMAKGTGSYITSAVTQPFQNVLIPTERISVLVTMSNIIEDLAKSRGLQNLYPIGMQTQQKHDSKLSLIDFMSNYLNAIESLAMNKGEISKDSTELISGSLTVDSTLPYFIKYRSGNKSIPLLLISSGILQLIPIIVLAESGQNRTLVIEEPEINLHANKQVQVAEYLWSLVEEKNKRVFVSTHSDYFVMRLAHLSKDNKDKTLRVYLLSGGKTKPLKIDENGEIEEIETIGEVLNKLILQT